MENASTGTGADQRCEGTTWKTSPAKMYSTIRATVASNRPRLTFERNSGISRACSSAGAPRGTGPASAQRISPMTAAAFS
jgi:hypothetical protein